MKKAVIFGDTNYSGMIYSYIKNTPGCPEVSAFVVDRAYIKKNEFCGIPVRAAEDILSDFPPVDYDVYICIGYQKMNEIRRTVFNRLKDMGYHILNYIHPDARVYGSKIGEGNIVLTFAIIGLHSEIGNCNIFMDGSVFGHDTVMGNFNYFSYNAVTGGYANVGNCCFFGLNSSIANKLTIGDKTMVGVGSVVTESTEEGTVIIAQKPIILKGKSHLVNF